MAARTNRPTVTQHLFPSHCSKPSASLSPGISPLCTSSWREDVTSTCLSATPTFCSSHLSDTAPSLRSSSSSPPPTVLFFCSVTQLIYPVMLDFFFPGLYSVSPEGCAPEGAGMVFATRGAFMHLCTQAPRK